MINNKFFDEITWEYLKIKIKKGDNNVSNVQQYIQVKIKEIKSSERIVQHNKKTG